jgi:hypothetical protein
MTELLAWMAGNPWLVFFLAFLLLALVRTGLRHLTLLVRGWPPAGLDADGDML